MHIKTRNVNTAFRTIVGGIHDGSIPTTRTTSRVGDVLQIPEPVTLTYSNPRERVLFNSARDCNPFFHVYEALWMLAGRNDVAPLAYYNSNIANYSDDGKTFNGAYGYRWRNALQDGSFKPELGEIGPSEYRVDQLKLIIDHLKAVPDSRRAVLHMSNVEDDLLKMDTTKDQCCNLVVTFAVREKDEQITISDEIQGGFKGIGNFNHCLDMTVFNRSNDLVWGALGANVVHFSFLQEYMAAYIDVDVGVYHQITNNLHAYQNDKWQPEKWLADDTPSEYDYKPDYLVPLVKDPATFDRECAEFVERHKQDSLAGRYNEPFLQDVAQPMCIAFHHHKRRDYESALMVAQDCIKADDWRIAATNWLMKRKTNYEARQLKS